MFDNIAAISTGVVNQPISIIRVSGPDSFSIVSKIFSGTIGSDKTITYGYIREDGENIDEVLISWFKGKGTFTGEDVVEINAHGSVVNSQKILELCLVNGARMAEPGEFSRRAFLNGKMDLIKAEAIHDLIFSKTENQAKLAVRKFSGETSAYVDELKEDLLTIIATIETNIDYPEYDDIEKLTKENLLPKLNLLRIKLVETIKLAEDSKYVTEGVRVALVGRPNAGKSSLLNTFIQEDKAIVAEVPGTTRDIVEGEILIKGLLIHLIDTAGIHSTTDQIEQKGIQKSLEQIKNADLVIHLVEATTREDEDDFKIKMASKNKLYIKVLTKSDLKKVNELSVSSQNNDVKELTDEIKAILPKINLNNSKLITNPRQQALVKSANDAISSSIQSLSNGFSPDEAIIDIKKAWEELTNITGKADNEKLLDQMFKNFCLGK